MFKALKSDFNKSVLNIGFLGAVLVTTLLCFTSTVYIDSNTEKAYTAMEAAFMTDPATLLSIEDFASINVFQACLGGYVTMFLPIIAAFPFMVAFCAERNSGCIRLTIMRSGKYRYYFSKFISALLGGGLALFLGVAIYGLMTVMLFPDISLFEVNKEIFKMQFPHGVARAAVGTLASSFVFGAVGAMPAFFLSSFCRNPYLITCIPFMLCYIWSTVIQKLINKSFTEEKYYDLYDKVQPFNPTALATIFNQPWKDNPIAHKTVIFNVCYCLALLIGFVVIMNRRTDKGS